MLFFTNRAGIMTYQAFGETTLGVLHNQGKGSWYRASHKAEQHQSIYSTTSIKKQAHLNIVYNSIFTISQQLVFKKSLYKTLP